MHIDNYEAKVKEDVLSLLANAGFKRPIIDWQFENCCDTRPIVAKEGDGIVGFNGVMPVNVQYKGERINAAWSCDFIVKMEFQCQGIGTALKQRLHTSWPLIMALGVSEAGKRALKRSGWVSNGSVRKFTRLMRGRGPKATLLVWFQTFINRIFGATRFQVQEGIKITLSKTLPKRGELDALWAAIESQYEACVVRNWEYLNWRYSKAPFDNYEYLLLEDDSLEALGVISRIGNQLTLVDYVGPRKNRKLKEALINHLLSESDEPDRVNCTTSDPLFRKILFCRGFLPASAGHLDFFVTGKAMGLINPSAWFLMGGDSDTEMLDQARAKWGHVNVSIWDEAMFLSSQPEWDDLRRRAGGDPLFMGWLWQSLWWKHFGHDNNLRLHIIEVRNKKKELVALAPFCQFNLDVHGVSTLRLEALGNLWQGPETMRSEYIEPLIDPDWLEPASTAIADSLFQLDQIDDVIMSDCPVSSRASSLIMSKLRGQWLVRQLIRPEEDEARYALLPSDMNTFLSNLGPNTRRRLYGRRKLLQTIGHVRTRMASLSDFEFFFEILNRYHVDRWGRPVFEDCRLAFHVELAEQLLKSGNLRLSRLTVGNQDISILYNIVACEREYNLQMGFDQNFLKGKLSPGILHLGFAIEAAILENRREFDLLAGFGKKEQYKNRLTDQGTQLCTWQAIQPKWRQLIYALRGLREK